jgi:hypothetical protein
VVKDYLLCTLFYCVFTLLLIVFGNAINRKNKSISENLITGYLVYSFCVAIIGIPLQVLNVPWIVFGVCMGVLWIGIGLYILYRRKYNNLAICKFQLKEYLTDNWMIYVVGAVMIFMLLFYYAGFWLGNHQDDGYYITKVATLPYSPIGGNYNYSVGTMNTGFNSYIVNTWELEASVYVKVLGVMPTLFLRLFQSAFYYFLYLNLIKWVAEIIIDKLNVKANVKMAQYVLGIVPLMCAYYIFLSDTGILVLRDGFHLNTGMFLGASFVKVFGCLLFGVVLLQFDAKKNIVQSLVYCIIISVVLISKSTIALPIIIVSGVAAGIVALWQNFEKKGKVISFALAFIYIALGIIIPNSESIQKTVKADIISTKNSLLIYPCIIIFLVSFFMREQVIYKLNAHVLLMIAMIAVPQCNDIFEECSVYDFVGGRAWSAVAYYFIILNVVYIYIILRKIHIKDFVVRIAYGLIGILSCSMMLAGFQKYGGEILPQEECKKADMRLCLSVIRHNMYFAPDSTIELGHQLEELAKEKDKKINIVMPKAVLIDGTLHFLAVSVRTFAPDVVSLSALERFNGTNNLEYKGYTQQKYDGFVAEPNETTYEELKQEIQNLNVDCIVVKNPNCGEWLEKDGYQYYATVGEYYIWNMR